MKTQLNLWYEREFSFYFGGNDEDEDMRVKAKNMIDEGLYRRLI